MKKLSLVLVLAMLFSFMAFSAITADASVIGEVYAVADGWNAFETASDPDISIAKSVAIRPDSMQSAPYSLGVTFGAGKNRNWGGNGYMYVFTDALSLDDGEEYTMNFKAKDAESCSGYCAAVVVGYIDENDAFKQGSENYFSDKANGLTQVKSLTNGWAEYNYTFTYTEAKYTENPMVGFVIRSNDYNNERTFYFDDVSMADSDGNDVGILNGDFDAVNSWDISDGWKGYEVESTKGIQGTRTATVVTDKKFMGNNSVKMYFKTDKASYWGGEGFLYAVAPYKFAGEKTYEVTFAAREFRAADGLAAAVALVDASGKIPVVKKECYAVNDADATSGLVKLTSGSDYWNTYKYTFTTTAAQANTQLAFVIRSRGWDTSCTVHVDNVFIRESGNDTVLASYGFGGETAKEPPKSFVKATTDNWREMYVVNGSGAEVSTSIGSTGNTGSGNPGDTIARSGMYGLNIKFKDGKYASYGANGAYYVYSDPVNLVDGEKYTATYEFCDYGMAVWSQSFFVGTVDEANLKVSNKTGDHWFADAPHSGVGKGNWKRSSFEFTYDKATMGEGLRFIILTRSADTNGSSVAFDNVSITATGSNVNLVKNGDFESVTTLSNPEIAERFEKISLGWSAIKLPGDGTVDPAITEATIKTIEDEMYDNWYIRSAYTGLNGLNIRYDCAGNYDYAAKAGTYTVYSDVLPLENGKTYNVKFKAVGRGYQYGLAVGFGQVDTLNGTILGFNQHFFGDNTQFTKITNIGIEGYNTAWQEYEFSYTHDASKFVAPRFGIFVRSKGSTPGVGDPLAMAFDDIEVYEDGSEINILKSGTFETLGADAPYLTKDGVMDNYISDGAVANADITNASKEAISAALIIAYYTMDEETEAEQLVKVDYIEDEIPAETIKTVKLTADLTGAEDALYAYIYVWDGVATLRPLTISNIFEIAAE